MLVHWFNPDNDLALACGAQRYTPPRGALALRRAGECLPLWYACPGERVLAHGVPAEWFESVMPLLGGDVDLYDHSFAQDDLPSPWGWSAAARTYLCDEGFATGNMPQPDEIDVMRSLSHRRLSVSVSERLRRQLPSLPLAEPAREVADLATVESIIDRQPKTCLKAPWSSSGRGVVMVQDIGRDRAMRIAADAIRRQGSVMVERQHDKVIDFAKIFHSDGSEVRCIGTSVFATDHAGAYTGNLLACESARLAVVGHEYSLPDLAAVTSALEEILAEVVAPGYRGILGVDMLVDRDGVLDAVVEINLRKTMGYVAMRIADTYLADGIEGIFSVTPCRAASPRPDTWTAIGGKLTGGLLNLVPPNPHFAITAEIGQ